MSYYNTTSESGDQLKMFHTKAMKQDKIIADIFRTGAKLTAFDVEEILIDRGIMYPITSIRRSLNTLESYSIIKRLEKKVRGFYGRPVNQYQIFDK